MLFTTQTRPMKIGDARQALLADKNLQVPIFGLVILCVLFNPLLAFLNANVMPITTIYVMVVEGVILAGGGGLVFASGSRDTDSLDVSLAICFVILSLLLSMINEALYLDFLRNIAIIALFSMLGARTSFDTLMRIVATITTLVLLVLLLEAFDVSTYVAWFEPAEYYENTRGITNPEFNDTGLFANTLSFESRFSFGILSHRASSLFLEQVSLANFAIVLLLLIVIFWSKLSIVMRVFLLVAIVASLMTTDSRTALLITFVAMIGFFVFPRIPNFGTLLVIPACLLVALLVMADMDVRLEDDVVGRLSTTMRTLADLEFHDLLGFNVFSAAKFADSGYTYVLYSSTIFGLLILWVFVAVYTPQLNAGQKRCAFMLNTIFATSLLVAGTSIFSIKIAALMWLIAGVARQWPFADGTPGTDPMGGGGKARI